MTGAVSVVCSDSPGGAEGGEQAAGWVNPTVVSGCAVGVAALVAAPPSPGSGAAGAHDRAYAGHTRVQSAATTAAPAGRTPSP